MRISIKNLRFLPSASNNKEKANHTFPNGYHVTIEKDKKNNTFDCDIFPEIDYLDPIRQGTKQDVLDYLNEVADIPEKLTGLEDFDMDEDD